MDITDFVHDQAKQQFRLTVDKHIALVDYVMHGNKLMQTPGHHKSIRDMNAMQTRLG